MLLEVHGVRVRLGSSEILEDVTLKVRKAEMIALLGPNGSGKSTLLKTIFGILKPESGVVYLDGKAIAKMGAKDVAKLVGYLPQEGSVTNLSVIDVVLLGRTPYIGVKPSTKDVDMAKRALENVGLKGFEHRIFSQLSGGEKQKVLLARVFAQQTKMLLLDEPTSHLDISSQIEIIELLRRRVNDGSSAIVAMHDINLAASFCDHILMLKHGKVVYAGKPEEVITPESIKDVFGADVNVRKHAGKPFIVPKTKSERGKHGKRIHVICGGGSGENIIYILNAAGYTISAGVLNALDTDWEAAREVSGRIVGNAPFSPISEEAHKENINLIKQSDAVILTNMCVGSGNLLNLHAALEAAKLGKLFVISSTPFSKRNFCGKEAEDIYEKIVELAKVLRSEKDLMVVLNEVLG